MSSNHPGERAGWFWICIEDLEDGVIHGTMQNHYQQRPVEFWGLDQLFRLAQAAMDKLDYPQCSVRRRSFSGCGTQRGRQEEYLRLRKEAEAGCCVFPQEPGACAAFEVRIYRRANATWQGSVTFYDRRQRGQMEFRSALELMLAMQDEMEKWSSDGKLVGRGEEKPCHAAV